MLIRYWPHALIAACLLAIAWVIGSGLYQWGYDTANVRAEKVIGEFAKAEAEAQEKARAVEQRIAEGQAKANDEAEERYAEIHADYERRISGAESTSRRLHQRWQAAVATCELSRDSAAAAAAAEQDRLRVESGERVVRDVRLAQAERDEAVDRYVALQEAYEALRRPAP